MLGASREEALLKLLTEVEDNIAHSWPDHKYKPWKEVKDAESDNDDFWGWSSDSDSDDDSGSSGEDSDVAKTEHKSDGKGKVAPRTTGKQRRSTSLVTPKVALLHLLP